MEECDICLLLLTKLEKKYNKQFKDVFEALDLLLHDKDWDDRERIGFK